MSNTDGDSVTHGGGLTRPPKQHEQALEAAKDGLTRTELTNMVFDLESVHFVHVGGEDEDWRPTEIDIHVNDDYGTKSDDILKIMRAAGWKATYVTFSRNRISFQRREQ